MFPGSLRVPPGLVFWREWPFGLQRRFAQGLVVCMALFGLLVWAGLYQATQRAEAAAGQALERYLRVADMAQEIRMLEGGRTESLAGTPMLIAARQVSRDVGLEEKLTSVRPALQGAGRDGVQLYYERLSLTELIGLLEALHRETGLKTSSLSLSRRLDNPSRADLQLVLFR